MLYWLFLNRRPRANLLSALAIIVPLGGCAGRHDEKPKAAMAAREDKTGASQPNLSSVSNELRLGDLALFKEFRDRRDVLRDVQWRGALVGACEDADGTIFAIE